MIFKMENLIKEHVDKFGKEPNIIGMFWNDPEQLMDNIADAIDENKPYDEYAMLTEYEQRAFDNGKLVF